jgi:type IV fimbrial biogenesis protein FimT
MAYILLKDILIERLEKKDETMKRNAGFTLIELIVTLSILTAIIGIAVPNILNWLPRYYLKSAGQDLYSNFQMTKMEAMKRNANVVLAFVPPPAAPNTDTYQIFVDDGTGAGGIANDFIRNGTEEILKTVNLARSGLPSSQIGYHGDVTLNSAAFSGSTTQAGFNSRGMPAKSRIGNIVLRKNNQGTDPLFFRIVLSIAGHIRAERSSDGINWY